MRGLAGGLRQNGYVVDDLDAAAARWVALGAGPFFIIRHLPLEAFAFDGSTAPPDISIALGNLGDLQIELIEQHDDAPSPYLHFHRARGAGLHHVSLWTTDYDGALAAASAAGQTPGATGQIAGSARFAYFGADRLDGTCLEVSDLGAAGEYAAVHAFVHAAAVDWDGADPVRDFPLG